MGMMSSEGRVVFDEFGKAVGLRNNDGTVSSFLDALMSDPIYADDKRYGGFWTGSKNDCPAIQNALEEAAEDAAKKRNARAVVLPRTVCARDSVYSPAGVFIYCNDYRPGRLNTYVRPHQDLSLATGFVFNGNSNVEGDGPEVNVYTRPFICGLFGIYMDNWDMAAPGFRLFQAYGGTLVRDIYATKHTQIIKKPAGYYVDNWSIKRIHFNKSLDNTEPAIELAGTGDALEISGINAPVPASGSEKAIKLTECRGGSIDKMVNGTIEAVDCSALTIKAYHSEYGQVKTTRSNVSIRGAWWAIKNGQTYYPIEVYGGAGLNSYSLSLEDVDFVYGLDTYRGGAGAEVKVGSSQVAVHANNCRRVGMIKGVESAFSGIRLHNAAGAAIAAWNEHAHYLSVRGSYVRGRAIGQQPQTLVADFGGVYISAVVNGWPSTLAAATYWYRMQIIVGRSPLDGRSQSYPSASQAVTTGQAIELGIEFGTNTAICMLRVYRGVGTDNNFDKYVDIPVINATSLIDDGDTLSGWPWIPRAAGAGDSLSSQLAGSFLVTPAGRVALA